MGGAPLVAVGGHLITPRLLRRSLRRGLRWRVLVLFWAALAVPGAIAAAPVFAFLRERLDHWPGAPAAVAWMDGATSIELVRALASGTTLRPIALGLAGAALALLACAPFVAGAAVAAARVQEPPGFRALLAGAGELYGRMLRMAVAGLIPLGLAAAVIAGIAKLASDARDRVRTETAADRALAVAAVTASIVLFVAHLLVDGGRAQFAADPARRSALAALLASARVASRRPLRTLAVGALGTGLGLGIALAAMAVRLQVAQGTAAKMAVAWLLAQAAQCAIGWGRAIRIEGLAELARADAAERLAERPAVAPAARPAADPALDPPRSGAAR